MIKRLVRWSLIRRDLRKILITFDTVMFALFGASAVWQFLGPSSLVARIAEVTASVGAIASSLWVSHTLVKGAESFRAAARQKGISDDELEELIRETDPGSPRNARFLIQLFMRGECGDALLGDLEERFAQIRIEHGLSRARFWYWFQVVVSLRPLLWVAIKRASGAVAAYEAIRKLTR
jgi:hypothetical protein